MGTRTIQKRVVVAAAVIAVAAIAVGCNRTTAKDGGSANEAKEAVAAEIPRPPAPISIAAGTSVVVRTSSSLSTKSNPAGSPFTGTLVSPLVAGEKTIAPKGAEVEGRVVHSDPGGRVKGRASIAVQLTRIHLANGRPIPVTTNSIWRSARNTKKRDAVGIGVASGVGAAIGAIAGGGRGAAIGAGAGAGAGTGAVLATRGAPAVLPAESVLRFRLREQVTVAQEI